jgi:sulfur carrier protein
MEILINGETRQFPSPLNVIGLLRHLQLQGDRIAVELNHQIVRRDRWAATELQDKDRLEIVHFVGGG